MGTYGVHGFVSYPGYIVYISMYVRTRPFYHGCLSSLIDMFQYEIGLPSIANLHGNSQSDPRCEMIISRSQMPRCLAIT